MRFGSPMIAAPSAAATRWYEIRSEANEDVAHLYIYDVIDSYWGVNAEDFVKDLKGITAKEIHVHLNTPGGYVFDGLAIYNALASHPAKIVTMIDGYAASMGSIIALAGDEVHMARGAFVMIHNPWVVAIGDSSELRETAALLDKMKGQMVSIYQDRMNLSKEEIEKAMDVETWYTADEALAVGFASEIIKGAETKGAASNRKALSKYKNVPESLKGSNQPEDPSSPDDMSALKTKLRARLAAVQLDETE